MGIQRDNGDEIMCDVQVGNGTNKDNVKDKLEEIKERIKNNYSTDKVAPWQIIEDRDWLVKTLERLLER